MTNEEQALAWAQCARHDGDEGAAKAIEALVADLKRTRATLSVRDAAYDEMEKAQHAGALRIRELMADLQRAEADNAALLGAIRAALIEELPAQAGAILTFASNRKDVAHPGAALLEELRALRKQDSDVRDVLAAHEQHSASKRRLMDDVWSVINAADALKAKP